MDYKHAAQQVLDAIGGASNIVSAAHCATRLRLVIADNDKVDKKALENAEGAKGVFEAQGQLQIIFGTGTVNKVYDEFTALSGIGAATILSSTRINISGCRNCSANCSASSCGKSVKSFWPSPTIKKFPATMS